MGLWNSYDTEAMDGLVSAIEGTMHNTYEQWDGVLDTMDSTDDTYMRISDETNRLCNLMHDVMRAYDDDAFNIHRELLLQRIVKYMADMAMLYLVVQQQHTHLPFNKKPEFKKKAVAWNFDSAPMTGWISNEMRTQTVQAAVDSLWAEETQEDTAAPVAAEAPRSARTPYYAELLARASAARQTTRQSASFIQQMNDAPPIRAHAGAVNTADARRDRAEGFTTSFTFTAPTSAENVEVNTTEPADADGG